MPPRTPKLLQAPQSGLPTSTSTRPPHQCSRKSNPNQQEPPCSRMGIRRWQIPHEPVGQDHTTSRTHPKPPPWIQNQPQTVSLGTNPWTVRLQCNTHCTTRHQGPSPLQSRTTSLLVTPCLPSMVHRTSPTTLPVLHSLGHQNTEQRA